MELTYLIMTFYTQHMLMAQTFCLKDLDSVKNVSESWANFIWYHDFILT